ncbi:MAG: Hpt domain-containing protein [Vicinamibacterales bacterium]
MGSNSQSTVEFDRAGLVAAFGGDASALCEMVAIVAKSVPQHVAELRAAAKRGDASAVAAEAHAVRGTVGNVGAATVADLAREIEMTARTGSTVSEMAFDGLERAAQELVAAMSTWSQSLRRPGRW